MSVVYNIPKANSTDDVWIEWYKALKKKVGKQTANVLFVQAFSKYGRSGSVDASTTDLRSFMKKQGVDLGEGGVEKTADFLDKAGDYIGTGFKAYQYIGIGLGVIVVGSLGILLFNLVKNPRQTADIVTDVMPQTRGIKAMSKVK